MITNRNVITGAVLGVILGLTVSGVARTPRAAPDRPVPAVSPHGARAASHLSHQAVLYSRIPLYFEINEGQAPPSVRFISRGAGYGLYLTATGPLLALNRLAALPSGGAVGGNGRVDRVVTSATATIAMRLVGAYGRARISGRRRQAATVNYLIGKDPKGWHRAIPTYAQVAYSSIYPGIDLVFHGRQDQLEYDFDVAPGADPRAIRLAFSGVDGLRLDKAGRLHLSTSSGEVVQKAPVAYQEVNGLRRAVASRYVLIAPHQVAFSVSGYDPDKALVIDPVLSFSSYLGGADNDRALAIARDPNNGGTVYITGRTASDDFLATAGAYDTACGGRIGCAQTQLSDTFTGATLDANLWSASGSVVQNDNLALTTAAATGSQASVTTKQTLPGDFDAHVTLDKLDEANKVTGLEVQIGSATYDWGITSGATAQQFTLTTGNSAANCSSSAPVITANTAAIPFEQSQDVEVVRTQGTLTFYYRTPKTIQFTLAGTCTNVSTADAAFKLFVTTTDAIAKTSVFDDFYGEKSSGAPDAFVMRLDDDGKTLGYATFLGGSGQDEGLSIAVDASSGNAFVAGRTDSADFPTPNGPYATCPDTNSDSVCDNGGDAFIAEIARDGSNVLFGTYFGGCYDDAANAIAVDGSGDIYIAGYTSSAPDTATSSTAATCVNEFPLKSDIALQPPLQTSNMGRTDAFVAKFEPQGANVYALGYSTFLGGTHADEALGIAVSSGGEAYITGDTSSSDFPLMNPIPCVHCDTTHYHAYVAEINATGTALVYSTLLGGSAYDYGNAIAVDSAGEAYVTGWTRSVDFPVTGRALQAHNDGSYDIFFTKLNAAGSALVYSTYLGTTDTEVAQGLALDANGNVWLTGYTMAPDFLVSLLRDISLLPDGIRPSDLPKDLDQTLDFLQDAQSALDPSMDTPEDTPDTDEPYTDQPNLNNYVLDNLSVNDLATALVQLDPSLDLNTMKSLSRSDLIGKIFATVDGYVDNDLQPIQHSRSGTVDAFVVELTRQATDEYAIGEATYLGGLHEDYGMGITLDDSGNPYVVGYTLSDDFPTTDTALQSVYCASDNSSSACGEDGFVSKLVAGDADLSVSIKNDAPRPVNAGTTVTTTMTVTNNSATQAVSGVKVTDNLDVGFEFVSAASAQGNCTPAAPVSDSANDTITCALGTLAPGASTTATVVATAQVAGETITQTASVTGLATDNVPANNRDSVSTTINVTFIAPPNPPHPVLSQKFPTFQGIDPPGGGGLGLPSLSVLTACAAWRQRARRARAGRSTAGG